MKNILNKLLLATSVSALIFSCTDLEEELVGELNQTFDVTAPAVGGAAGGGGDALAGSYAGLRGSGTANHFGYFSIQGLPSDEMCIAAKGGDWYDGGVLVQMHRHTYDPTNGIIGNTWNGQYNAIQQINNDLGDATKNLTAEETMQLRALRAYFYWRLLDLYGRVKIVTESATGAQASQAELYAFIESELLTALGTSGITATTTFDGSGLNATSSVYRVNRYAALGFLTKLYLNHKTYLGAEDMAIYQKAEYAAQIIMDSGQYQLCGVGCSVSNLAKRPAVAEDPDNLEGYAAVFAPNNDNNIEHIFSVNYDEATAGGMNFAKMTLHYSSQLTWNFEAQPWNGYATLEEFYNSYDTNDLRRANNFIQGPQKDYGGSALNDFAADDPGGIVLNYTPFINELEPNAFREGGARLGKFSFQQFGRPDQNNDFPIVRYGDVMLMYAEARYRQNNWSDATALSVVNQLRTRAGVGTYSSMTSDEFLAERGREMFQESSRRTDLIRWGIYSSGTWWEKSASPAHKALYPIPFDILQSSTGYTQNTGY
ncbi:MAG: RagB/SusD family nutrient uptake outer membrane protein [Flavobacteriaceae bacterium]|nr:RagB/SusD family nutrient uptake outer membrane protein [Flavobacteriaceae bacterium]